MYSQASRSRVLMSQDGVRNLFLRTPLPFRARAHGTFRGCSRAVANRKETSTAKGESNYLGDWHGRPKALIEFLFPHADREAVGDFCEAHLLACDAGSVTRPEENDVFADALSVLPALAVRLDVSDSSRRVARMRGRLMDALKVAQLIGDGDDWEMADDMPIEDMINESLDEDDKLLNEMLEAARSTKPPAHRSYTARKMRNALDEQQTVREPSVWHRPRQGPFFFYRGWRVICCAALFQRVACFPWSEAIWCCRIDDALDALLHPG